MPSLRWILASGLTLAVSAYWLIRRPSKSPQLLECPNTTEVRAIQRIGPDGGTLQVGDHRLVVPPGAVARPVTFTGVLRIDRILKVHFQADGAETFAFLRPASLTLSYARCTPPEAPERLRIYKIDPRTNRVLRDLDGDVNLQQRTITAPLDRLSAYTAGSPT